MNKQEQPIKSTRIESAGELATTALNAVPMVGGVLLIPSLPSDKTGV
ncbi:MAG: hypothetical protein IID44_05320 [Planctomycetes bacterium]|nr:hypothetical protein [Planctomycetota bacterium]